MIYAMSLTLAIENGLYSVALVAGLTYRSLQIKNIPLESQSNNLVKRKYFFFGGGAIAPVAPCSAVSVLEHRMGM
jgi:hypothetical protein